MAKSITVKIQIDETNCGKKCPFLKKDIFDRRADCMFFNEPLDGNYKYDDMISVSRCFKCHEAFGTPD